MPYLRVAHLPIGQSDIQTTGAEFPHRILAIELVMEGRLRKKRRVSVFLAFFCTARIDAPAITDDEHDRSGHTRRTLPTFIAIDKRFPAFAGLTTPSPRIYIAHREM